MSNSACNYDCLLLLVVVFEVVVTVFFFLHQVVSSASYRLVGLVVKASALRTDDPEFDSRLRRGDFSGSSHTSDLKIGTPVATLPGTWPYRVSAGTGWPGVSIL